MKRLSRVMITILILLLITACSSKKENNTEKIVEHLEKTVEIEAVFKENQEKIYELEKQDEKLYKEIIGLGTEEYEKIVNLTEEAIGLLDERLEYVAMEKESLEQSKEEFIQIEPLMEAVVKIDQKEQLKKMYETMMNRYDAYDQVYESYSASILLTKQLYELFQQKTFNENEVYSVLESVNEGYDQVMTANDAFNNETALYNSLKEEYYKSLSEN